MRMIRSPFFSSSLGASSARGAGGDDRQGERKRRLRIETASWVIPSCQSEQVGRSHAGGLGDRDSLSLTAGESKIEGLPICSRARP